MKDLSAYSRADLDHAIEQWIIGHRHSERNREILKRHLLDGATYEQIAEETDLSVRQIKNIVYKTEEVLFKHI